MHRYIWLIMPVLLLLLVACGGGSDQEQDAQVATSTDLPPPSLPATAVSVQITDTLSGPSLTPSPTFPATHTPPPTGLPPSAQPSLAPTDTPPPYIDNVREGDTCGSIAVRWGLDLVGGAAAVREANNLNSSCTNLPFPGQVIIPRPTSTPTPPGYDVTLTVIATSLPPSLLNVTPFALYEHCVEEGDTLTSLSLEYNTSRERICELNPLPDGLDCRGCNFTADGPNARCAPAPLIGAAQCLNVPGPTHTPPPTATLSGSETPTPIPTYLPPQGIQPVNGASISGAVQLIWLSAGQLKADEYYKVVVYNEQNGELMAIETVREPGFTLPREWQPVPGESLSVIWSVEVIYRPSEDSYVTRSDPSPNYRFIWSG